MSAAETFIRARDRLLALRTDLAAAQREFRWPQLEHFNWALDYFDAFSARNERPALRLVNDTGLDKTVTFAEMSRRSSQIANFLREQGLRRGDRILIMLGNVVPLWETMLAAMKLGAVMIPATTLLEHDDLHDRLDRGNVKAVVTHSELTPRFANAAPIRIAVGDTVTGWLGYERASSSPTTYIADGPTRATDLLLFYFTSGTTARPKLVAHTHASYPIGHLSTMYWLGLRPGDVHVNLSSPGWAKHAWSCFFAPWNAGVTVVAYQYDRFSATALLDKLVQVGATTFCAPPTVWRLLIQQDLVRWKVCLREAVSAGEPLNPEVIERVRDAWGLTIRDGFGQTETTAQVGNSPGQPIKPGSMGRPLPGYTVVLLTPEGSLGNEGEICLDLQQRPLALMTAYLDDPEKTAEVMHDGYYHTGDVATRDADGYLTYVGRTDDVFKSSDYRISPFELESVLMGHPAVAEAAVVPSADLVRLSVPKAFVVLAPGHEPNAKTAESILHYVRERVSPYKRVRRIEFASLPKTISGKIRRAELRGLEQSRAVKERRTAEYWEEDFSQ